MSKTNPNKKNYNKNHIATNQCSLNLEAVKEIAQQIPEFTEISKNAIKSMNIEFQDYLKHTSELHKETIQTYSALFNNSLEKLSNNELSEEEKNEHKEIVFFCANKIEELNEKQQVRISEKHDEQHDALIKYAYGSVVIVASLLSFALGINPKQLGLSKS